jgi:Zn-dependent protease with chaperone function
MEIKPTVLGTMIGLATVAFGLIAAGAWNKFIGDAIALFLKPGNGVLAELIYAIVITIVAILVIQALGKVAEREADLRARLPFTKKPAE